MSSGGVQLDATKTIAPQFRPRKLCSSQPPSRNVWHVWRIRLRLAPMKTLTIRLPDALLKDLEAEYASVPMSLADACLVRMTEIVPEPVIVTTGSDFRSYRRHSR